MMRRIALISEHASPLAALGSVDSGGQNVYVAQVARQLARMGYAVDIFTRRDNKQLPDIYKWDANVRVIHVPAGPARRVPKEKLLPYMKAFTGFMLEFIQRQEKPYDLIHAHFWMSALVAADIKNALGIPFVVTFHALGRVRRQHQGDKDLFPDDRFAVEERVIAEADGIVAECPQDELDLRYLYDADPRKITIIPCGFDPSELWPMDKALSRRALGIAENERVVLQLGRMVPRKGVDTVVRGFAKMVRDYGITGRLVIVGGESDKPDPKKTPEIGRLLGIARQEGISDLVTFTGQRDRQALKNYYNAADVFISTPWYEPFGITPVEAMACGTPVIGAKVGGIKFTVCDGETGFLVPPNDPEAVAERLAHLFQNPGELKKLGHNAVKRANEFFTWQRVSEALVDFYEQIATGSPAPVTARPRNANGLENELVKTRHVKTMDEAFESAMRTLQLSQRILKTPAIHAANAITACFARGGKVMVCGNGGSAADAQHFAAEFVGRFNHPGRKALPVLALNADTAFLTAWANDVEYDQIFARQVEAFGHPGDLLIGISTSGRSKNLVEAFKAARSLGMGTIALLGGDGGALLPLTHISIVVPSANTQRIQEMHIMILHLLCELVEERFVPEQLAANIPAKVSNKASVPNGAKAGWGTQPGIPVHVQQTK